MFGTSGSSTSDSAELPLRAIWISSAELETDRLRRRIASSLGWILAAATLAGFLARIAAGPVFPASRYLAAFFIIAFLAVPVVLRITGRLRLTVVILLTLMLSELAAFSYLGGGLHAPALVFLTVIPVASIFLAGLRVGLLATALALFMLLLLGLLPALGLPVPEVLIWGADERFARGWLLALACAVTATLAWFHELQLARLRAALHAAAASDPLTGLANRARLEEGLLLEWHRLSRQETGCLSVILFDIDHFKSFNDTYGHPAGDECLKTIASVALKRVRRASDFVARYGGEEFLAVLPATASDEAYVVAENLRRDVVELQLRHSGSPEGILTISFGVATVQGPDPLAIATLLAAADEALYRAKNAGRNRVEVYGS